jgi:hypothetical protein
VKEASGHPSGSSNGIAKRNTPAHRAFDFWVGDWTVTNTAGRTAATSRVERILDLDEGLTWPQIDLTYARTR